MKKNFLRLMTLVIIFLSVLACQSHKTLRGYLYITGSHAEQLARKSNSVCYLLIKDRWGVPISIKRWLNPKFPLYYRITANDRLADSRPWDGPFQLEAYLFLSENNRRELPPPPSAATSLMKELVYPSTENLVDLTLE